MLSHGPVIARNVLLNKRSEKITDLFSNAKLPRAQYGSSGSGSAIDGILPVGRRWARTSLPATP